MALICDTSGVYSLYDADDAGWPRIWHVVASSSRSIAIWKLAWRMPRSWPPPRDWQFHGFSPSTSRATGNSTASHPGPATFARDPATRLRTLRVAAGRHTVKHR